MTKERTMQNTFKDDFTYHWGLATCTLEDDERVIANEQLENILQSDLFKKEETTDVVKYAEQVKLRSE